MTLADAYRNAEKLRGRTDAVVGHATRRSAFLHGIISRAAMIASNQQNSKGPSVKHKLAFAAIGCALAASALAAPETFNIDSPHTSSNFEVTHLGINTIPGRFDMTKGKIVLDREAKAGSIEAEIDVNTINTGYARRDTLLKSEDYFNAEKFPTITFRATRLRFKGDNLAGADGELTMMGVTKPVTLELESFRCIISPANKREICGAIAKTTIKRADFGMTRASRSIGEEVKISINLEAIKG